MGYLRGEPGTTDTKVLQPMMDWMKTLPEEKRTFVVWQALHSQGRLKPKQFLKTQGNGMITHQNKLMDEICQRLDIPVLSTYDMTLGAFSFDGGHYGMQVNVLRSHLYLNYIEEKFGMPP